MMYKFLLVEDSVDDAKTCKDVLKRMCIEDHTLEVSIEVSETFESAVDELKNDYDGVIIDINLNNKKYNGNDVIQLIIEKYRIPVAVMTATPDTDLDSDSPITVFKKGEAFYDEIIKSLIRTNETGLFNVIGGKGILEKTMNKVLWENLYKQIEKWEKLSEEGVETEKILLRYAIAHIQELIDEEVHEYVTEEMYIKPPISDNIRTGSIVELKNDCKQFVVLSPPCDLIIRNGRVKTDRIMICEIDALEEVNQRIIGEIKKEDKKRVALKNAIKNNYNDYYHWLPKNSLYIGGYINFRNILTYPPEEFFKEFEKPKIRVQDHFVKDILARFSRYYSRQGQPDFDFEKEARLLL